MSLSKFLAWMIFGAMVLLSGCGPIAAPADGCVPHPPPYDLGCVGPECPCRGEPGIPVVPEPAVVGSPSDAGTSD